MRCRSQDHPRNNFNDMEWISVKDRLPDYGQDVLFISGKNEVSVGQRFLYEEGTDIWATEHSIYFNDHINQDIQTCKFWMPLPEAHKE